MAAMVGHSSRLPRQSAIAHPAQRQSRYLHSQARHSPPAALLEPRCTIAPLHHHLGSSRRSRYCLANPKAHLLAVCPRQIGPSAGGHGGGHNRGSELNAASVEVRSPTEQPADEIEVAPGVFEGFWQWQPPGSSASYQIRYQRCGVSGPAALMVHGFGGNWCAPDVARRLASSTCATVCQHLLRSHHVCHT